jgi:hypothetical protein
MIMDTRIWDPKVINITDPQHGLNEKSIRNIMTQLVQAVLVVNVSATYMRRAGRAW